MINNVVLVGRLTRPVELSYTSNGVAVARFSVAVDRRFQNQNGERETDFINCVMWRKAAENFANFTRKGSLVGIEGRIQTRSYENQQGQRVYTTEVVAENFSLLESRAVTEQRPVGDSGSGFSGQSNQYQSQGGYRNNNQPSAPTSSYGNVPAAPFLASGDAIDISDDDLPF